MMRCMAGFVKLDTDEWSDVYTRVRGKIEKAIQRQPVRLWADELCKLKEKLCSKLQRPSRNALVHMVVG